MNQSLSSELVAYTAGLFDGEGCVRFSRNIASTPQLDVSIANSSRETLEELRDEWLLGSVHCKTGKNLPVEWAHGYAWRIMTAQGESFLRTIQPYVRIKADQVELALRIREMGHGRGVNWSCNERDRRDKLLAELSQLKKKYRYERSKT